MHISNVLHGFLVCLVAFTAAPGCSGSESTRPSSRFAVEIAIPDVVKSGRRFEVTYARKSSGSDLLLPFVVTLSAKGKEPVWLVARGLLDPTDRDPAVVPVGSQMDTVATGRGPTTFQLDGISPGRYTLCARVSTIDGRKLRHTTACQPMQVA